MVSTSELPELSSFGIATDVLQAVASGQTCGSCGAEFVKPHGRPVLCRWCWAHAFGKDRAGYRKAYHAEC